jgi:hypothetical protein
MLNRKPFVEEYPDFFAEYISLVREGNLIDILSEQSQDLQETLSLFSEEDANKTYAFGKWTLKEVIGHLLDNERLFVARAVRISRGDKQMLPGYDQDDYVKNGRFFRRSLKELKEELLMLRAANILLFKGFDDHELMQRGYVNDYEITVHGLLFSLAGHEKYHILFIKQNYIPLISKP